MAFQLDLLTAQLFVATVEDEGIGRAAERLGIAPATIGKRLRELEDRLGVTLFHRNNRGVEPTPAGATFLRRARALLYEANELERELRYIALGSQPMIRLCASEAALFGFVPGLLRRFFDANPNSQIDLIEALSPAVARQVEEGAADLGIFTGVVSAAGLVVQPCYQDRLVVIMPPGHALAGRPSVRFAEVLEHELVAPDMRGATAALVLRAAAEANRALRIAVRADGFDAVCRLVQHGFGAGLVPSPFHDTLGRSLGLVAVPLDEPWALRRFSVCAPDPGRLSGGARRLLDAILAAGEEAG